MRKITKTALLLAIGMAGMLHAGEPFLLEIKAMELDNVAKNREELHGGNFMWMLQSPDAIIAVGGSRIQAEQRQLASTSVTIPADGEYYLWACYAVHETHRRTFSVILGTEEILFCQEAYGTPEDGISDIFQDRKPDAKKRIWTREVIRLSAGEIPLKLTRESTSPEDGWKAVGHPPIVKTLLITNDPEFDPNKRE